ncbi:MAG: hypothetical protein ACJZ8M_09070 [Pseudohongiellaceae bacterium]
MVNKTFQEVHAPQSYLLFDNNSRDKLLGARIHSSQPLFEYSAINHPVMGKSGMVASHNAHYLARLLQRSLPRVETPSMPAQLLGSLLPSLCRELVILEAEASCWCT